MASTHYTWGKIPDYFIVVYFMLLCAVNFSKLVTSQHLTRVLLPLSTCPLTQITVISYIS